MKSLGLIVYTNGDFTKHYSKYVISVLCLMKLRYRHLYEENLLPEFERRNKNVFIWFSYKCPNSSLPKKMHSIDAIFNFFWVDITYQTIKSPCNPFDPLVWRHQYVSVECTIKLLKPSQAQVWKKGLINLNIECNQSSEMVEKIYDSQIRFQSYPTPTQA